MRILILLLNFTFIVSAQNINKTEIKITNINNLSAKDLTISIPEDDLYTWNKSFTRLDKDYYFQTEIDEPKLALVRVAGYRKSIYVILKNGQNLTIEFDQKNKKYKFKDDNSQLHELLNNFYRMQMDINEWNKYKHISDASELKKVITELKNKDVKQLNNIKNPDKVIYDIVKKDIDYYYAHKTIELILFNEIGFNYINNDLLKLYEKTIIEYPLETNFKTMYWFNYGEIITLKMPFYKQYRVNGKMTNEKIQAYKNEDLLHEFDYNLISEYKNETVKQDMLAFFVFYRALSKKYEKSLIKLYMKFKINFPNNKYVNFIKPHIDEIKQFHNSFDDENQSNIEFLNSDNINNWEDLKSKIKGDKYYIDIWATWCGPCIQQFQYNKQLNKVLKEKGYKKLYISIDKHSAEEKWKKDIIKYNLTKDGIHFRANEIFINEFKNTLSINIGQMQIPQYLIVNSNGKIINKNAPRPENIIELEKVLE
jgi:thiol-disulfide isomerase/thioredoxin